MEAINKYESKSISPEIISSIVLNGDVSKLSPVQKTQYYNFLCSEAGIKPAFQPFQLLKLNGKEMFYATKSATQQLCEVRNISTEILKRERVDGIYIVTVRAKMDNGRFTDEDGAVKIDGLQGDNLANAIMKATTKAKRRATLALCGLGFMDESELDTVPNAVKIEMPKPEDNHEAIKEAIVTELHAVEIPAVFAESPKIPQPVAKLAMDTIINGKTYQQWKIEYNRDDKFVFHDWHIPEGRNKGKLLSELTQDQALKLYEGMKKAGKCEDFQLIALAYSQDTGIPF